MKTTLDLPDDLLIEAQTLANQRQTTLTVLVEHALRRELQPDKDVSDGDDFMEYDEEGFPRLKRRGKPFITSEMVYQMMDDENA